MSADALAGRGWYRHPLDHPSHPHCLAAHTRQPCDGTRGKHPLTRWSIRATTDPATIRRWAVRWGAVNFAISCGPSGLVVIDEDAEGEFERWCRNHGHEVPDTYRVRTGHGWHYYFRQPVGKLLGNAEDAFVGYKINVRGVGGYVVAAGSEHASGVVYTAEDDAAEVIGCPEWIAGELTEWDGPGAVAATPAALAAFLDEHTGNDFPGALAAPLKQMRDAVYPKRHKTATVMACWVAREAAAGAYPAQLAYDELLLAFEETLDRDGEGEFGELFGWAVGQVDEQGVADARQRLEHRSDEEAEERAELADLVGPAATGAVDPYRLPETFWTARPELAAVRQFAHARAVGADAVFHCLLAELASLLPGDLRVDTGLMKPASLNYFAGLVGGSGIGKSSSAGIAADRVPVPPWLRDHRSGLPLGSGEGLCEAYMGTVTREVGETYKDGTPKPSKVREQVRHNVSFYVDEGKTLVALMGERNGSTLGQVIRTAWMGAVIGQTNASAERTREVREYALGLTVGFQPCTATPLLLDGVDEGTPQRFVWCVTDDPSVPDDAPDDPGPMPDVVAAALSPFGDAPSAPRMELAASIRGRLRQAHVARQRGQRADGESPYDSHRPLTLVKISGLLTVLAGRSEITEEDWSLAETIYGRSAAIRDRLIKKAQQDAARASEAKTAATVATARRVHEATAGASERADQVARNLVRKIDKAGPMAPGALRRSLRSTMRDHFEAALEHADARGWLTEDNNKIALGDSRPS
ncbi:bifunctional DNA primase/polymerase [Streptomyces sp. NPDC005808]|uniref:bifunctional DNA primase/polymerase n=1 Tax=Streptomyces sp. NPDC005808 TaxID=3364734 RepID=UPI0036B7881E